MSTSVLFKRGTEANLFNLKPYTEGCFYLTTDSHRLYTGVKNGDTVTLEAVNEGVQTVENLSDLPVLDSTATNYVGNYQHYNGRFYYVKKSNILVVASGDKWVQINPDTTLDTTKSSITVSAAASNQTTVTTAIKDTSTINSGKSAGGDFSIKADGDLTLSTKDNIITISYSTPDETAITVDTDGIVDNNVDNKTIGMSITTKQDGTSVGDAKIKVGNNMTADYDSINDTLTINADNMYVTSVTSGTGNGITGDGATTEGFYFEVTDGNSTSSNKRLFSAINPKIKTVTTTQTGKGDGVVFKNGTATIDAYSTSTVDSLIADAKRTINAMSYKGTLSSVDAVEKILDGTTKVSVGDTYKIGETLTSTKEGATFDYNAGDIIICNVKSGSTEETNGYIEAENLVIEHIEAGNDYSYKGEHSSGADQHTASLYGYLHGSKETTATLKLDLNASDKISLTTADTDKSKVTIGHKVPEALTLNDDALKTQDTLGTLNYTAITGIETDSTGHIRAYKTGAIKVVDTHNALISMTNTVSDVVPLSPTASTSTAKVSTKLDTVDKDVTAELHFKSDTLSFSQATTDTDKKTVQVDLVWGEF